MLTGSVDEVDSNTLLGCLSNREAVIAEEGSDRLQKYFSQESNFYATSLCFAEALGALKVKRFYRKEISDEQYFCACEELLACAADNTIQIEEVEIKDSMVFVEVKIWSGSIRRVLTFPTRFKLS